MKLLGGTKKVVDKDKNRENVPNLEIVQVVFGQLINISPHAFTMMNTVNTEFPYVEVWYTDQASKALEIEDKINLTLIIG